MPFRLKPVFIPPAGSACTRREPCRVCGATDGQVVGYVGYWDFRQSSLVRCPSCGHIQLDPMLTEAETAKGCLAYFVEETIRTSPHEMTRNCVRNFRRGVLFGYSLKHKGIIPAKVLEAGPGSGYFTAGLQFVFPGILVTVMDVNTEVLEANRRIHGYDTMAGIPDRFNQELAGRFDLVIARDILEHVTDISAVIASFSQYLVPGGHLHFITPNGREDVWKHILSAEFNLTPSELLINHVNYFDGKGLKDLLSRHGFSPVAYYSYSIKRTLRGAGWKHDRKLAAPASEQTPSGRYSMASLDKLPSADVSRKAVLDQWYIRPGAKWLTLLYSLYQHCTLIRLDPAGNMGHEFWGLFKKTGRIQ